MVGLAGMPENIILAQLKMHADASFPTAAVVHASF
jgi:hypothetical protein